MRIAREVAERARLRPPPRRRPPRHQAREHPAARRAARWWPTSASRWPRSYGGRDAADRDRALARHAALHESRAGDRRPRARRAERRLLAGLRALRDAGRGAAVHRADGAGDHRAGDDRGAAARSRCCGGRCRRTWTRRCTALEKLPADRFATAAEFAAALASPIPGRPWRSRGNAACIGQGHGRSAARRSSRAASCSRPSPRAGRLAARPRHGCRGRAGPIASRDPGAGDRRRVQWGGPDHRHQRGRAAGGVRGKSSAGHQESWRDGSTGTTPQVIPNSSDASHSSVCRRTGAFLYAALGGATMQRSGAQWWHLDCSPRH